ncbi:hypothetical protein B7494_g3436 [Chlorociboria aeruginascens]|nr:hypothetical protein B7494_g3436 [Chlorociboria aeruginascens]
MRTRQVPSANSKLVRMLTGSAWKMSLVNISNVETISVRDDFDCHSNSNAGPLNPDFEEPGLAGWTATGSTFASASVTTATTFWNEFPFNQHGNQHMWGYALAGDPPIGELRSSTFQASNVLSFLVGGGYDPDNLWIGLALSNGDQVVLKQTGLNDEAYVRIIWDTRPWAGQDVYILVHDSSTADSWGHINLDDVRTGCDALQDGPLTFNIVGQANQPADGSRSDADLYAVDPYRPQFHYTPYQGWINDPCGLIEINGDYQLFNQFAPQAVATAISWSHAHSSDAVHWRRLPIALPAPDPQNPSDTSGRWTGSSADFDGLKILFTEFQPNDPIQQVVRYAQQDPDGHFEISQDPVIGTLPPNATNGFRDPKIFKDDPNSNTWKVVVGSGSGDVGNIQLYQSQDLQNWDYIGIMASGDGGMWECPNFFPLGGKWVLFYGSNGQSQWRVGTYDGTTFTTERSGVLDVGNIYAAQMFEDSAGRFLVMGWIYNFGTYKWTTRLNGYVGATSITRQLFINDNGDLGTLPIDDIRRLQHGSATSMGSGPLSGSQHIGSTTTGRLQSHIDLDSTTAPSFAFNLFSSTAETVVLTFDVASLTLSLDTTNAGYGQPGVWSKVISMPSTNILSIDVLFDRSIIEVFTHDGSAFTANVYPRYQQSSEISLSIPSGRVNFHDLQLRQYDSSWK